MRAAAALLVGLLATAALGACGDDDDPPATTAATTAATPTATTAAAPPSTEAAVESTSASDAAVQERCGRYAPGRFEAVDLETSDGVALVGYLGGSGTTGVVLAHQSNADACGWLPYGAVLEESALVLAVNLRGFGASEPGPDALEGRRYDLDVVAAADALRQRGATRIVLVGASLGAGSVLAAAPQLDPAPAGVVALSPGPVLDGEPLAPRVAAAEWPTRIVGADDDPPAPEVAQELAGASSGEAEAVVLADGGHGWQLLVEGGPRYAEVDALITGLLTGG